MNKNLNKKTRRLIFATALLAAVLALIAIVKTATPEGDSSADSKTAKSDKVQSGDSRGSNEDSSVKMIVKEEMVDVRKYDIVTTADNLYMSVDEIAELINGSCQWNSESNRYLLNGMGTHIVIDMKNRKIVDSNNKSRSISIVGTEKYRKVSLIDAVEGLNCSIDKLYKTDCYWIRPSDYEVMPVEIAKKYESALGIKIDNYKSKYRVERIEFEEKNPDKKKPLEMKIVPEEKVAYLTFDDGPNENTPKILDALKKEGINATFFLLGKNIEGNEDIVKRIYEEGNAIGLHSMSHKAEIIYASPENFVKDMNEERKLIKSIIGIETSIIRPPYGSYPNLTEEFRDQLVAEGYRVWDWDVDSGDSKYLGIDADSIYSITTNQIPEDGPVVLLFHDKAASAEVLSGVVGELKKKGYTFDVITDDLYPVNFWNDTRVKEQK